MKYSLFIASELLSENAGTPRQLRKLKIIDSSSRVITITKFRNKWVIFKSRQEIIEKKNSLLKKQTKESFFTIIVLKIKEVSFLKKFFKFLKNDFLFEFFSIQHFYLIYLVEKLISNYEINNVYISSPPFPLLINRILKKKKIHLDMRDPWGTHQSLSKIKFHRKFIEKKFLNSCHSISVGSKHHQRILKEEYKINSNVLYNYADEDSNDFSEVKLNEFNKLDKKFIKDIKSFEVWSYIGTTPDGFYNLNKIAKILEKRLFFQKNLKIYFIGNNEIKYFFKKNLIESERVNFLSRVNRREAMCYLHLSKFALHFGHYFDGYPTTKLFEMIYIKKPIIPLLVDQNHEPSELLKKHYGIHESIMSYEDLSKYLNNIRHG